MLFPEGVGPTIQVCFSVSAEYSVWHKIIAHKILKNSGGDIGYCNSIINSNSYCLCDI